MPRPPNGAAAASGAADPATLRTLALVGPQAAGKTSLAEALLHRAGAIGAPGSLERGSTVSDHDPLERRMQHSLNAAVLNLAHDGTRIHLIDTPGSPDLIGQALPALEAVETAAVVINASVGIEPMAVRMMEHTWEMVRVATSWSISLRAWLTMWARPWGASAVSGSSGSA